MTALEIREAAKSLLLFLALTMLPIYIVRHALGSAGERLPGILRRGKDR